MSGRFDRLSVRLPTKLKQRLVDAARSENRSLSDYIVLRLQEIVPSLTPEEIGAVVAEKRGVR